MIIDAHQHFWQRDLPFDYQWLAEPEHSAINRDFLPADLQPRLEQAGVTHSIFVQTQHRLEENDWALQLAATHPFLLGVVGWVNLASDDCEAQVERYRAQPGLVGIRHVTQDEPDDDFIIRPDILRGLKILERHELPFDLLFFSRHLRHATTVASHVPELPLVIDHLSKPEIRARKIDDWSRDLRAAARHENVYCKLSGLITEADWETWTPADLKPYVDTALDCFGPERLMYGSDWPVCELAGSYQQVFEALDELLGDLGESERDAIYCRTAQSFYRLD